MLYANRPFLDSQDCTVDAVFLVYFVRERFFVYVRVIGNDLDMRYVPTENCV